MHQLFLHHRRPLAGGVEVLEDAQIVIHDLAQMRPLPIRERTNAHLQRVERLALRRQETAQGDRPPPQPPQLALDAAARGGGVVQRGFLQLVHRLVDGAHRVIHPRRQPVGEQVEQFGHRFGLRRSRHPLAQGVDALQPPVARGDHAPGLDPAANGDHVLRPLAGIEIDPAQGHLHGSAEINGARA